MPSIISLISLLIDDHKRVKDLLKTTSQEYSDYLNENMKLTDINNILRSVFGSPQGYTSFQKIVEVPYSHNDQNPVLLLVDQYIAFRKTLDLYKNALTKIRNRNQLLKAENDMLINIMSQIPQLSPTINQIRVSQPQNVNEVIAKDIKEMINQKQLVVHPSVNVSNLVNRELAEVKQDYEGRTEEPKVYEEPKLSQEELNMIVEQGAKKPFVPVGYKPMVSLETEQERQTKERLGQEEQRRRQGEQRRRQEQEEQRRRRQEQEEQRRRQEQEEQRRRQEQEEQRRRQEQEEQRRRQEQEEQRRRQEQEEQRRRQEQEEQRRRQEEARKKGEESLRKEAEEQRKKQEQEEQRKKQEQEEQRRKQEQEEQRRKQEEERQRKEAEEQRKKQLEEEQRKSQEQEKLRRRQEDEKKLEKESQAIQERLRQQKEDEEQTRKRAEEKARQEEKKKQEEAEQVKAEQERLKLEEKKRQEEQRRRQEEHRIRQEQEEQRRRQEEARKKEEERQRKEAEEQRKRKEEQRKKQEEERQRKEAEEKARAQAQVQAQKVTIIDNISSALRLLLEKNPNGTFKEDDKSFRTAYDRLKNNPYYQASYDALKQDERNQLVDRINKVYPNISGGYSNYRSRKNIKKNSKIRTMIRQMFLR
jgi:hypothetical protein